MSGAPLRFLGLVAVGWTAARVFALWPGMALPDLRFATPLPEASAAVAWPHFLKPAAPPPPSRYSVALAPPLPAGATVAVRPSRYAAQMAMLATNYGGTPALGGLRYPDDAAVHAPPAVWRGTPFTRPRPAVRLSMTSWMIARPGGGSAPLVGGGQLGGSQAGVRASYALNAAGTFAVAGRLSSPLGSARGREAAIGFDWQPSAAVPIKLIAEQRFALDGGARTAPALGLAGGFGGVPLPADFRLDAYAQAGIVGFTDVARYADGALRVERSVWGGRRGPSIAIGAGLWGAAQPGVARLDIGPQAVVRLPTGGTTLRVGLEWRQRVAGNARPGSGPALSIGADF